MRVSEFHQAIQESKDRMKFLGDWTLSRAASLSYNSQKSYVNLVRADLRVCEVLGQPWGELRTRSALEPALTPGCTGNFKETSRREFQGKVGVLGYLDPFTP